MIEKDTKRNIEELYIVGGGSKSDVSMQLTADIFNMPAKRLQTHEVCAIGAAINAGLAVNMFENEEEAVKNMNDLLFSPDPFRSGFFVFDLF